MKIRALGDSILFEFVDESRHGMFAPKLSDTILVTTPTIDKQDDARWGIVVAAGPEVGEEIEIGKFILIDSLKWTTGVNVGDGKKVWKTTYPHVSAISDTQVRTY